MAHHVVTPTKPTNVGAAAAFVDVPAGDTFEVKNNGRTILLVRGDADATVTFAVVAGLEPSPGPALDIPDRVKTFIAAGYSLHRPFEQDIYGDPVRGQFTGASGLVLAIDIDHI
jgi:hypothetical protein